MPANAGGKAPLAAPFDAAALLPADRSYWAFMGSLTTPPCSEGVRWQVLRTPVELSRAQLAAFRKLYPMNARPVQPLNGRKVEFNG
jgi:carbonic anhydrase